MRISSELINKKRPAKTAAITVQEITREKRALIKENKIIKYTINYYEHLFPHIVDFKEIDDDELIQITNIQEKIVEDDAASLWLTQHEYAQLSTKEKISNSFK